MGCCSTLFGRTFCVRTTYTRVLTTFYYAILFIIPTVFYLLLAGDWISPLSQATGKLECKSDERVAHHLRSGEESILRVSVGLSCFFFIMLITTMGTKEQGNNWRDSWHHGWWPVKLVLWAALCFVPLLICHDFLRVYFYIAACGAISFLIVEILTFIEYVHNLNETWVQNWENRKWLILAVTIVSYVLCIITFVFMFVKFVPSSSCKLHIAFITVCLLLVATMTILSCIRPKDLKEVDAGLMCSAILSIYVVYLCCAGILSEPPGQRCNSLALTSRSTLFIIIGMVITCIPLFYTVWSTSTESHAMSFKRITDYSSNKVPYGYGFFHFVFMTGSMYMAMVFIGWNLNHGIDEYNASHLQRWGWVSVWIQMACSWLTSALFIIVRLRCILS